MIARPPAGTIPDTPGSYQFKDSAGRIIYVGKAKSLRNRLSNYFQTNLPPRTAQMVATCSSVQCIRVRNEAESLPFDYSLPKHPDYDRGPDTGSVCDSLGLLAPEAPKPPLGGLNTTYVS